MQPAKPCGSRSALTADMDRRVHDIAWELRPSLPQGGGLRSALESYVSDWSARFKIAANFRAAGLDDGDLPPLVETTIFRIVQEAFTNIVKHAGAKNVSLVLARERGRLQVTIEDDGKGFDRDAGAPSGHLGLVGINERLALIDGTLRMEIAQPTGTVLTIIVPFANGAAKM